jgi:anaerobic ribonucleoside-triphosphate reductase activating protein
MTEAATLRISRVHFPVTALGPGTRLGIWVQGCPLACPGCMSRDTWDTEAGTEITVTELVGYWRKALTRGADGITISGGEPLVQATGMDALLSEIGQVRRETTQRTGAEYDVMLYTGYELDELDEPQEKVTQRADVLVTGRYRVSEPTDLIWRGSANQRLRLRTDLGRRRYAEYVDFSPSEPPLQLGAEPTGFWIIGVPRKGTLSALERGLGKDGLRLSQVSWRPS